MIHADIDPSLCTSEPTLDSLDDGFSPPARETLRDADGDAAGSPQPCEPALGAKSLY